MDRIKENDLVALLVDRTEAGLHRGDVGTVIQVLKTTPDHSSGFVVEFVDEFRDVHAQIDISDVNEIVKLRYRTERGENTSTKTKVRKKKETGDSGEKLVLDKLRLLGYTARLKPTNHPVFDIECTRGGCHGFTVQVKNSTAPGTQAWIGVKAVDGELKEDLYFVVIRQWNSEAEAEFFVVSHNELKHAWQKMPLTKPNGQPYKRTGHLAWHHLEPHLERWDKLPR